MHPSLIQVKSEEGFLIFNDTMIEKQCSDENEIMGYHFHHSKAPLAKAINLLNLIYHYCFKLSTG